MCYLARIKRQRSCFYWHLFARDERHRSQQEREFNIPVTCCSTLAPRSVLVAPLANINFLFIFLIISKIDVITVI